MVAKTVQKDVAYYGAVESTVTKFGDKNSKLTQALKFLGVDLKFDEEKLQEKAEEIVKLSEAELDKVTGGSEDGRNDGYFPNGFSYITQNEPVQAEPLPKNN